MKIHSPVGSSRDAWDFLTPEVFVSTGNVREFEEVDGHDDGHASSNWKNKRT